jgi:hypothetical protein
VKTAGASFFSSSRLSPQDGAIVSVFSSIIDFCKHAISLVRLSICENHPAVKRICPATTSPAGSYSKIGGGSLNRITQPNFLAGNKSGQPYPVRRLVAPIVRGVTFRFSCHAIRLRSFVLENS